MKTKIVFLLALVFFIHCFPVSSASRINYSRSKVYTHNSYNNKKFEYSYIPNLTPKQKYRIEQFCIDRDKKLQQLDLQRKNANRELLQLKKKPGTSSRQIERLKNKLYNIDKEVSKTHYKTHEKVLSVLTPPQREVYLAHTRR